MSLYYVTQHCCSEIQIGFYSVFPADNLQMLGIQLRLCKDHIAFETKILWSRCCCSQDALAYPAKASFPSLFLRAFSENRGYCSVKPALGCSTPVPFTYQGSWSTACWGCWNGTAFIIAKASCIFPTCRYKSAICARKCKFLCVGWPLMVSLFIT